MRERVALQVSPIVGPQRHVVKATGIGSVEIIQEYRIRDLLHRNTSDIFSSEKRKRDALDSCGDGAGDIHFDTPVSGSAGVLGIL